MARSHNDDRDEIHFKQGSCRIILKPGDLLSEDDVDALVIPTPDLNESNPDNFALYKSINSRANEDDKREIRRVRSDIKLLNPQVISKNDRGYIFALPPYLGGRDKAHEFLRKTYISCLNLAVKNNFRTIAFPAIGCGVIGFNTTDAARCIYSAFESFGQSNDGNKIDEIRIIIYDNRIWGDFTTEFINLCHSKGAKIKLTEITPKKSNASGMSPKRDEKNPPRGQSQEGTHYDDDFENERATDQSRGVARQTSTLDPESPEYRPKHSQQRRDLRRYLINGNRTELHILQGDILQTKVDAIVNAANEEMLGGSGVDGAIHKAAGSDLLRACRTYKQIYPDVRLPTGRSRILLSYNMSRTTYYIINTAGPRYDDAPPDKCQEDLTSCYTTSLALANLYDLETIAFTAISCGIFGYPIDKGAEVALKSVNSNADTMKKIFFVLKDDDIYDAWIRQAENLQFPSLDDSGSVATSTSKQPTTSTNTQKATEKSNANDASAASNRTSETRDTHQPLSVSTEKPAARAREGTSQKLATNSDNESDDQEHERKQNDDETTKKKSEKKKTDSKGKKETPNNPPKQKQDQNEVQNSQTQGTQKNSNKSILQGGFGRGKNNK